MFKKLIVAERRNAFALQQGCCYYCGHPMWETHLRLFAKRVGHPCKVARRFRCTVEHVVAKQDNGGNRAANLVAACRHCNQSRHAADPLHAPDSATYRAYVRTRMAAGDWHPLPALNSR